MPNAMLSLSTLPALRWMYVAAHVLFGTFPTPRHAPVGSGYESTSQRIPKIDLPAVVGGAGAAKERQRDEDQCCCLNYSWCGRPHSSRQGQCAGGGEEPKTRRVRQLCQ